MAKRKLALNTPIVRGNGLTQTFVELDYIYIHEDSMTIYTKQGNEISIPINPARQAMIDAMEDAIKARLDNQV